MSIKYLGIVNAPAPDNADAGHGRRLWLAERIPAGATVVDLGGTGNMLKPWHTGHVTACDDLSGFGTGHKIEADEFIRGDVQGLAKLKGRRFDVAVLAEVIEHVPNPSGAIAEAARIADKVLITTPCEQRWRNAIRYRVSGHIRFTFPELFAMQLKRAGVKGEHALLEFGSWSFCVAEVTA